MVGPTAGAYHTAVGFGDSNGDSDSDGDGDGDVVATGTGCRSPCFATRVLVTNRCARCRSLLPWRESWKRRSFPRQKEGKSRSQ